MVHAGAAASRGYGRKEKPGLSNLKLYYKEDGEAQPITYEVAIDVDEFGQPYVLREGLWQRPTGVFYERPAVYLIFSDGKGFVFTGEEEWIVIDPSKEKIDFEKLVELNIAEDSSESEIIELEDRRRLGIATLGALKQHPRIAAFRRFIEGWYLSYFTPDAARGLPLAGPQPHLNIHGDNLGNVVQFMEREHPQRLRRFFKALPRKYPALTGSIRKRQATGACCCGSTTEVLKTLSMPSRCRTGR